MMPTRFPTLVIAAALLTALPSSADSRPREDVPDNPRAAWLEAFIEARQGPEQTDHLVKVFPISGDGTLDLSNVSGDVRVTGTSGREIRVEATRRVRHRDADVARRLLDQLRVDMTHVGSRVEVRTVYPRRPDRGGERGSSARVDYVVSVPAGTAVLVKTISGDASVTKVTGEVRAEAVSGDITVTGTPNVSLAKTVSGDVTARDVGDSNGLTLGTVSGSVVAIDLKARSLDCSSVSGDIRLTGVQAERVQARSVSGNIEVGAALSRGGRYDFGSHSGDIRMVLASDIGFELDASTFSGSVRSEVPVTLRSTGGRGRRESNRTIRGVSGDGAASLSVTTFSGTIVISRK